MIPKPAVREFVVTHISFLDEPKPTPVAQEVKREVPLEPVKSEPVVEKKPEKKVTKEALKKVTPMVKPIQEPILTPTPSAETLAEQSVVQPPHATTQESAPAPSSRQKSDDVLTLYLAKVRQKIQESLRYPSMAKKMGLEGETIVQFLIHANGTVDASSVKIAKSSGKAVLDRNAIDAVLDAVPFALPPKEELEIIIPVVFKLKS